MDDSSSELKGEMGKVEVLVGDEWGELGEDEGEVVLGLLAEGLDEALLGGQQNAIELMMNLFGFAVTPTTDQGGSGSNPREDKVYQPLLSYNDLKNGRSGDEGAQKINACASSDTGTKAAEDNSATSGRKAGSKACEFTNHAAVASTDAEPRAETASCLAAWNDRSALRASRVRR